MNRRALVLAVAAALVIGLVTFGVVRVLLPPPLAAPLATPAKQASPGEPARRISATLYYVDADGLKLTSAHREVLFGESTTAQARRLMEALAEPAPAAMANALPAGTTVRSVFVTEGGDAYVDFGPELRQNHPGGSLNEIFTVYAIVHTLTTNLPAIRAVQILIDGHEVDSLAGHVDLRRPLPPSMQWLTMPQTTGAAGQTPQAPAPGAPQTAAPPAR